MPSSPGPVGSTRVPNDHRASPSLAGLPTPHWPDIRFLYVQSEISSSAFFRSRLATDTLAQTDGSSLRSIGDFHPLNAHHYSTHQAKPPAPPSLQTLGQQGRWGRRFRLPGGPEANFSQLLSAGTGFRPNRPLAD